MRTREFTVRAGCGHDQPIPYFWWENPGVMRPHYEELWGRVPCRACEDALVSNADAPKEVQPDNPAAAFVRHYGGKRYEADDPEVKLLNRRKRGGK